MSFFAQRVMAVDFLNPKLYEGRRNGLRDLCLISIFFFTGMRIFEVASLSLGSIKKIRGVLCFEIKGNGDKTRAIPISAGLFDVLMNYLEEHFKMDQVNDSTPLFLVRGERMGLDRISEIFWKHYTFIKKIEAITQNMF